MNGSSTLERCRHDGHVRRADLHDGVTVWTRWAPRRTEDLLTQFLTVHATDESTRLVVVVVRPELEEVAGAALSAHLARRGATGAVHGVYVTTDQPSGEDLGRGAHVLVELDVPGHRGERAPGTAAELAGLLRATGRIATVAR